MGSLEVDGDGGSIALKPGGPSHTSGPPTSPPAGQIHPSSLPTTTIQHQMTMSNGASSSRQPAAGPSHYSEVPQDARLISLIIASMGIQDIEPGVEMMLLEWAHREYRGALSSLDLPSAHNDRSARLSSPGYVHTILSDSLLYASHAHPSSSSNPTINLADVTLAVQSHLSHSLIQPPSKTALLNLASSLNSTPLPPISDRYGLRLPPKEHCLTNVNFNIVPDPLEDDDDEDGEGEEDDDDRGAGQAGTSGAALDADESAATAVEDAGDVTMTATNGHTGADDGEGVRRIKRSLEEDDDYD